MNFKVALRGNTQAALEAARRETEQQLKESAQVKAHRVVGRFATAKNWPTEDLKEVLGALGLEELGYGEAQEADTEAHTTDLDGPGGGMDHGGLRRSVDDTVVAGIGAGSTVPDWPGLSEPAEQSGALDNS